VGQAAVNVAVHTVFSMKILTAVLLASSFSVFSATNASADSCVTPAVPAALSATVSGVDLVLSYAAPQGQAPYRYEVKWNFGAGSFVSPQSSTVKPTTVANAALLGNQRRTTVRVNYSVRAQYECRLSPTTISRPWSAPATATFDVKQIAAPTITKATSTAVGVVRLEVTGAPAGGTLQVIRSGTVVATVPSSASIALTGQPRGMNVRYSVRAIATDGASMPSKEVFVALRSR
jgi:hypothetical protein